MENYYIIEHQKRPDGEINISETGRSSYKTALSYYHERYSKMIVNTQFVSVSLMLVDENLNVILNETLETEYKPEPEPQPETENISDSEENAENEGM